MISDSRPVGSRNIPCALYAFRSRTTGKFYFGVSVKPKKRWQQHFSHAFERGTKSKFCNALRKYTLADFEWGIVCWYDSEEMAREAEGFAVEGEGGIKHTYNSKPGGSKGGMTPCDETRQLMSLAKKGKPRPKLTEQAKQKISVANSGRKRTPEQCARQSERMKGVGFGASQEATDRAALARVGVPLTEEHRKAISVAHIGRPKSREQVERQRESLINSPAHKAAVAAKVGVPLSPETCQKMTDAWAVRRARGVKEKRSPETRQKMREAWARRKERKLQEKQVLCHQVDPEADIC